jgi:hypothetical protein
MLQKRHHSNPVGNGKPNWHTIVWVSFGLTFIAFALVKGHPLTELSGSFRGDPTYGIQTLFIGLGFFLSGVYLMKSRNKK